MSVPATAAATDRHDRDRPPAPGALGRLGSAMVTRHRWVFGIWLITLIAAAASVGLLLAATRARTAGWAVVIGLIWGGAVGNLLDRLFAPPGFGVGHVTDFLAYGNLFIGNLADVIIGIGVGFGLLLYLRQGKTRA